MMNIKLRFLIGSILLHSAIFCSQQKSSTDHIKVSAAQANSPRETTPVEKYLESQYIATPPSKRQSLQQQILCEKAFDFIWNIPNEHPKKKQTLLYETCRLAQQHQHKVDLDLADKYFKALEPIHKDNCCIAETLDEQGLKWACRKKRHAKKIAACYEYFKIQSGRCDYPTVQQKEHKKGYTLRELAEDVF